MIRVNEIPNSAAAKAYYSAGNDYYLEGQEQPAFWHGKVADMLGLSGPVGMDDFHSLCDNEHPTTHETLTAARGQRRVGYDFTFSVPKSVSLAYALGQDERLPDAFRSAVADTMAEVEREMGTRVRKGGKDFDRPTGNMLWCDFLHTTSRPIKGQPDPQLHVHAVAFNLTWDHEENEWKAGQFGPLKANAPYYQAVFRSRLATRLQDLGYDLTRTKDDFEITGIPERANTEFSRRTTQIEKLAEQLGVTRAETKAKLGATSREKKSKGLTWRDLLERWDARLKPGEREAINATVRDSMQGPMAVEDRSKESVDWALRHLLERKSVVSQRAVATEALKHGLGFVTPESVFKELGSRKDLIRRSVSGVEMVSTQGVLAEEKRIAEFATKGRGRFQPLSPQSFATLRSGLATPSAFGQANVEREQDAAPPPRGLTARRAEADKPEPATLSPSQQAAIRHVWNSRDRLILIRGAAGTGKTTLTKTALASVDVPWVILAPSAEASRGVLRRDGFKDADTLSRFLVDEEMRENVRGGLIWLDEASLAGARDVAKLTQLADSLGARVVLSGDRRQHKSVARGDVLALLEDRAGLPVAEVSEIKRQSGEYKLAVQSLANGNVSDGFRRLDAMGWVKEVSNTGPELNTTAPTRSKDDMPEQIATDYLAALKTKKPGQKDGDRVTVIAPTHAEGEAVTAAIRAKLKEDGRLKGEERTFQRLVPLHLTEAEKAERLTEGTIAQFVRPGGGFKTGQRVRVGRDTLSDVASNAGRVALFRPDDIRLAPGDSVRITANGKTLDGEHRLNNGAAYTVAGFTDAGNIRLDNGWVVAKDFGHLSYGYVSTSHAAQGKTVDIALVAMSNQSIPAMGSEQFYVSASRARHKTTVYVEDKQAVKDAIQKDDRRMLASDLVKLERRGIRKRLQRHVAQLRSLANRAITKANGLTQQREVTFERE